MGNTLTGWQQNIVNSPIALDAVFLLAIVGLVVAWKFMVEGLIE